MKWLLFIICMVGPITIQADTINFKSGTKQKVMIELFTSQGCSSCPPAEEFLNTFSSRSDLWSKYIPIALHVDYWDYLGWKDVYAKSQHSSRQREYARVTRARTVFTPAFFVNGVNWRPGFRKNPPSPTQNNVGNLTVTVSGNHISANFRPLKKATRKLQLNVAIVGMNLRTQIKRGENSGRYSRHSFVLLASKKLARKSSANWSGKLPGISKLNAERYALIAWVSYADSPAPIQAVGGYLPRSYYPASKVSR